MHILGLGLAPLLVVLGCAATARAIGGDPLLGAELGVIGLTTAWLAHLSNAVRLAVDEQRELRGIARPFRVGGRRVRLIESSQGPEAFVIGPFRPDIFVSGPLLGTLDTDELEAVLLHEEHHRRTRAPLRALALSSWMRVVGVIPVLGHWIGRRLVQLELDADRYAVAGGASRAAIASALVKCDRSDSFAALGYASVAEARVRQLVTDDGGCARLASTPVEWLAPALVAAGLAVCHLLLG